MKFPTFPILLFALACLLVLFTTCRKDDAFPRDSNNDGILDKKSFPLIKIFEIEPFSTEAVVRFTVDNIEPEDPIKKKWIVYGLDGTTDFPDTVFIDSLTNNFDTIPDLEPGMRYSTKIGVETSDDVNQIFTSPPRMFETPEISLQVDDEFVENEQELKVTALAQIDNFEKLADARKAQIDIVGFIWTNKADNSETTRVEYSSSIISRLGQFQGDFYYFDYSKTYDVDAFIMFDGEMEVLSTGIDTFRTESFGDFWVNIGKLPVLNDKNVKEEFPPVLPPALEGGISFQQGGMIYVGLGRGVTRMDTISNDFIYQYDPTKNKWDDGMSIVVPDQLKGRMYATVFKNGNDIYVGGGCSNCDALDDYTWENRRTIKVLEELKNSTIHNDYYKFEPTSLQFGPSMTLPNSKLAAYGFNENIGGGIFKSDEKIEGDLIVPNDINYEIDQIDPKEWHDLNHNGEIEFTISQARQIKIGNMKIYNSSENEVLMNANELDKECSLLTEGNVGLFCESCACWTGNCDEEEDFKDLFYKITKTEESETTCRGVMLNRPGYEIELISDMKTTLPNTINLKIEVGTNQDTVRFDWDDMNKVWSSVAGFSTNASIKYTSSAVEIWSQNSPVNGRFRIRLTADRTLWCEQLQTRNNLLNIDTELYYTTSCPNYIEVIPGTTRNDLLSGFEVANDRWRLNTATSTSGNAAATRYGAAIWDMLDAETYLFAGSNMVPNPPENGNTTPTTIFRWNGTQWEDTQTGNQNFNNRIHPFYFEVNGKGYVGGGEFANGAPVNLDLWEFDPDENTLNSKAGCGINSLTKGVGFGHNGKGYVFGNYNGEAQFYVYIPTIIRSAQ